MLKSLYLFLELFWCSRVSLPEVVTKVGAVTVAGLVWSCGHLFLWPISNVVQGKNPQPLGSRSFQETIHGCNGCNASALTGASDSPLKNIRDKLVYALFAEHIAEEGCLGNSHCHNGSPHLALFCDWMVNTAWNCTDWAWHPIAIVPCALHGNFGWERAAQAMSRWVMHAEGAVWVAWVPFLCSD